MLTRQDAEALAAGRATAALRNAGKDIRRFFRRRPFRRTNSPHHHRNRVDLVAGYEHTMGQAIDLAVQAAHRELRRQFKAEGRVQKSLRVEVPDPVTGETWISRSRIGRKRAG